MGQTFLTDLLVSLCEVAPVFRVIKLRVVRRAHGLQSFLDFRLTLLIESQSVLFILHLDDAGCPNLPNV